MKNNHPASKFYSNLPFALLLSVSSSMLFAADTTIETDIYMPMATEILYDAKTTLPVCIDPDSGKLGTGCSASETVDVSEVCKLYADKGYELPEKECTPRVVFATQQTYTGAMGGVSGANDKCQQAADNAGLTGIFKAWLSNDTEGSPATNFTRHGMFVNSAGFYLADGWSDFTSGRAISIPMDENKDSVSGQVWTNTLPSGQAISTNGALENCGLFFFDHKNLKAWIGTKIGESWSAFALLPCDFPRRIICVQQ